MADAVKAIIGALYLDQGLPAAKRFVLERVLPKTDDIPKPGFWNAKRFLQDMQQREDGRIPTYRVLEESGPGHDQTFVVGVYIGSLLCATGRGGNKHDVESDAASKAITART